MQERTEMPELTNDNYSVIFSFLDRQTSTVCYLLNHYFYSLADSLWKILFEQDFPGAKDEALLTKENLSISWLTTYRLYTIDKFFDCFSDPQPLLLSDIKQKAHKSLDLLELSEDEKKILAQSINSIPNNIGWAELGTVLRKILTKFVSQSSPGNISLLLNHIYERAQANQVFCDNHFPSIYLANLCQQPKEVIAKIITTGFSIVEPLYGSCVFCEKYSAMNKDKVLEFAVKQNLTHVVSLLLAEDNPDTRPKDYYDNLLKTAIGNNISGSDWFHSYEFNQKNHICFAHPFAKEAPTIAQNLIKKGANPNACYRIIDYHHYIPLDITKGLFTTPLQNAVVCGNLAMVKVLLQSGADPDTASYFFYKKETNTGDKVSAIDIARIIKDDTLRNEIITELAKARLSKYLVEIIDRISNKGPQHCQPAFTLFGESFLVSSLPSLNKFTAQEKMKSASILQSIAFYEGDKNSDEYYQLLKIFQEQLPLIQSPLTSGQLGIIFNDLKESIFHDKKITNPETCKILQEIESSLESVLDCVKRIIGLR